MSISNEAVVRLYTVDKLSTASIAEQMGTNSKFIQRLLKKLGVPLRNKAEAQKEALKAGRAEHPTEGKPMDEERKAKIGEKVTTYYASLTTSEKKAKAKKSKDAWEKRSDTDIAEMRKKAGASYAKTSRNGSKIENNIAEHLSKKYQVQQHVCGLIANINLEVDIYLPEYATIIEVDGPTHFLPIWGEHNLQKHIKADAEKAGLLTSSGFTLIRIKCLPKKVSATKLRIILAEIDEALDKIIVGKSNKHIELEIN